MRSACVTLVLVALTGVSSATVEPGDVDAKALVQGAIDHWRGLSSLSDITMVIHRPDWERTMTMRAWTRGDDQSLVRVL